MSVIREHEWTMDREIKEWLGKKAKASMARYAAIFRELRVVETCAARQRLRRNVRYVARRALRLMDTR